MKPLDPRLLRNARATRLHIATCVVLGLATAVLIVVQAELLSRGIADVASGNSGVAGLSGMLVALAAVIVVRAGVAWLQDSASQRSSSVVKSQLRRKLVAHAAELGLRSDAGSGRAGVAALATRGIDALDGYFGRYLPQLVLALIVPVFVLTRLVFADLTAAVTVAVTLPLIPLFMALVGMATEAANAKRWHALSRLSHHFLDVVTGLATLKIFGRAKAQAESVRQTTERYRTATMATLRVAFLSSLVLELLATLSVALVAVGVGLRLVNGSLDLRTGLLVIILAPEAYLPLRQVGAQYHAAAEGVAAAEQVFAIIEAPLAVAGSSTDVPDLRRNGRVRVRGASVAHSGRTGHAPRLAELSASQGEVVVVTGPSGAGKTTLLAVLLGFVQPDEGDVTIAAGGREVLLSTLDLGAWRRQIAWVDQTPFLFAGTIADNVRLSRPDAGDDEIRQALGAAGLGHMPIDRRIEESGRGLSAGERRRVAMARAILRDAALILLDEPTAGLDERTEHELLTAVRAAAARSIVIMVSHRPAAIAMADRVVVVESDDVASASSAPQLSGRADA